MSQSFIEEQLQELRDSTQELMMDPSTENVMQMMSQSFEKVFNILTFIINGNALQHSLLLRLTDENTSEAVGTELVQNYITAVSQKGIAPKQAEQHPVATSARARSESVESSVSSLHSNASSFKSTSDSKEVICDECGKIFSRGSQTDSITKHAKETSCKPFGCPFCDKNYKDPSSRNKHMKTHETQKKRAMTTTAANDVQPIAKRAKIAAVQQQDSDEKDLSGSQKYFKSVSKSFGIREEESD